MGDYATCVTEPLWERDSPEIFAYFASDDFWTRVVGEGGTAFAAVFKGSSRAGIEDQVRGTLWAIEKVVKPNVDLRLCLIDELGEIAQFSLSLWRLNTAAYREAFNLKAERDRAIHERIQRDMAADNGVPNPELEKFLDIGPKAMLTVEAWSEAVSEAWRLRQNL